MAGNFHQYEEALRELYTGDLDRFYHFTDDSAPDLRNHINFFIQRGIEGRFSIIMLNLLRFREIADYTAHPELTSEVPKLSTAILNIPFHFSVKAEVKWFLGGGGEF